MVVASSNLMGQVYSTSVNYDSSDEDNVLRVENVNNLGGFNNAAGITTVAQNAGANSLVQQSVATNASLFTE